MSFLQRNMSLFLLPRGPLVGSFGIQCLSLSPSYSITFDLHQTLNLDKDPGLLPCLWHITEKKVRKGSKNVHDWHSACVEIREQLEGVSFLLPIWEHWGYNSGSRGWQQVPFLDEPFYRSQQSFVSFSSCLFGSELA